MESEDFQNVFLTVLTERIVWKQTRTLLLHKGGLPRDDFLGVLKVTCVGSVRPPAFLFELRGPTRTAEFQMPALSHRDPDGVAFVLTHRLSISC